MKYGYREIRRISAGSLRNLCIANNWYTRGNNPGYDHLLYGMAGSTDQEFTSICFDIAKIAVTFFKEVEK